LTETSLCGAYLYLQLPCPCATVSTMIPTWTSLAANLVLRCEKRQIWQALCTKWPSLNTRAMWFSRRGKLALWSGKLTSGPVHTMKTFMFQCTGCQIFVTVFHYSHSLTYTVATIPEKCDASRMLHKTELIKHMAIHMSTYKTVHLTSTLQHNETWSAAAWPVLRKRHRPTVFFRHLRLTALLFP
jgi:hypothetical protein